MRNWNEEQHVSQSLASPQPFKKMSVKDLLKMKSFDL